MDGKIVWDDPKSDDKSPEREMFTKLLKICSHDAREEVSDLSSSQIVFEQSRLEISSDQHRRRLIGEFE